MASRTRDEMKQIIDRGESVFVRTRDGGSRIVSRHEDVPTEAELAEIDRLVATKAGQTTDAAGNPIDNAALLKAAEGRAATAKADAEKKIRELQAQIDAMTAAKAPAAAAPTPLAAAPTHAPAAAKAPEVKK